MVRMRSTNISWVDLPVEKTVLVIVDMQNEFLREGGSRYVGPHSKETVRSVLNLLERARAAGVRVIFIQSTRYQDSPEHKVFGVKSHLIEGSWGHKIIEELEPKEGETVIKKFSHDPFNNTPFEELLSQMASDPTTLHVVVTGVMTNICVYHTVTGLSVRNYRVYVPVDCCCSTDAASHEWALRQFAHPAYSYNVTLTESDKINFVKNS
jgi:nicotinamidase-related amidase